jgi:hypothetical protein
MALAVLAVALPGAALAERRVDLSVGVTQRSVGDALHPIADTESLWMPSLGVGVRILQLGELALHADLAFQAGSVEGRTFQSIGTELSVKRLIAGGRADLLLHSRVRAFGRAMLGTEWANLELHGAAGETRDRAWASTATASVGAEAVLIRIPERRFAVCARLEAAYTQTAPLSFRAGSTADELSIPMHGTDIGSLELSGAGVQAALAVQF